jgi:hypothetical protein
MTSYVYGYLVEPWIGFPEHKRMVQHNHEIIRSLPEEESLPGLVRDLFAFSEGMSLSYRNPVIHFGAGYGSFEPDLEVWLEKFESLLKKLYSEEVRIRVRTECSGESLYQWKPIPRILESFRTPLPSMVTEWVFEGDPRDLSRGGADIAV